MIRLLSALLGLALLLAISSITLLVLLRDPEPSLPTMSAISEDERRWGMELLQGGLGEAFGTGAEPMILTAADLKILAVLLAESMPESRLRIELGEGRAEITVALPLANELGGWLNLRALLVAPKGALTIARIQVGSLTLPAALTGLLVEQALATADLPALPSGIEFTPEVLRLQPLMGTGGGTDWFAAALTGGAKTPVLIAQRRLAALSALQTKRQRITAAELLSALLAAVPADAADPVAESRAAILALALYVNGRSLPDPSGTAPPRLMRVSLRGRQDIAQHFFTSGALTLQVGREPANLIGYAKELDDAAGASGFSFSDLAANRAGSRFAVLATAHPAAARRLQALARSGLGETDIMLAVDWLPERMSRAAFDRDFGGRNGRAYRLLIDAIDRRIEALPVVVAMKDSR